MQPAASLERLFYAGEHELVLGRTIDSATGDFPDTDVPYVVGALVFSGRADEAQVVYGSWARRRGNVDVDADAACRFHLTVAECRAGKYASAERHARAMLARLGATSSPTARYYFHQAIGLVRHFQGRVVVAVRHATRSRKYAVEARFSYGRVLALDLLGHALVLRGASFAGLTVLEQAVRLARGIGLEVFARTTASAVVVYKAHYGLSGPDPRESLEERLADLGDADPYSRRLIVTELARSHALFGEGSKAEEALAQARAVALPDGDRRARVRLFLAHAFVAGLREGEQAARVWLDRAAALVDPAVDPALSLEHAYCQYVVAPLAFACRPPDELRRCASATGLARAVELARGGDGESAPTTTEDAVLALVREVRGRPSSVGGLVASGRLGLLPVCLGRPPGERVVLDAALAVMLLESRGEVMRVPIPTEASLALLLALGVGPRTKERLVLEVWKQRRYVPERHDAMVHSGIARLRKCLEPHSRWVVAGDFGYRLAQGVELVDVRVSNKESDQVACPDPVVASPPQAAATFEARTEKVLSLARLPAGTATREVAAHLGISDVSAFRLLASMVSEGLVERTGQGRNSRYVARI